MSLKNSFGALGVIETKIGEVSIFSLRSLAKELGVDLNRLPFSIKILLENLLRHVDGRLVNEKDVAALARWGRVSLGDQEIAFMPARVILQDFTGVPVVADLAAMRDAVAKFGGDPKRINPIIPVDLVIDHSVQVDFYGRSNAFESNVALEFERNRERYLFLRWAQKAFTNFSVVPPGTGIVHQVNLEYFAKVVQTKKTDGQILAFPDSLVGTDSHTTMINGLGVMGWGVGGIEAEVCMLGRPFYMLAPSVLGVKVMGRLREGVTATDAVLALTKLLRSKGVVGKFVEFYGSGLSQLALADRATLANMAPECGSTMNFFPVDQETLNYLKMSGRDEASIDLVERYLKEQGLFRTDQTPDPAFQESVELDLGSLEPCMAGPRKPHDYVALPKAKESFLESLKIFRPASPQAKTPADVSGGLAVRDGSVVIAAITSCTNTSNPSVMIAAGLVAKAAVERGLTVNPYVKTSLAPGSRVVSDYLKKSGLIKYLEALNFHLVGYGCTTCIGNSGPLAEPVAKAIKDNDLVCVAVLSGNRNFEGRINPHVRASYLASPPLVVVYALAGRLDIDLTREPLGKDQQGRDVYLKDIWPSNEEVNRAVAGAVDAQMFRDSYRDVFHGDERWRALPVPEGSLYAWDQKSTYIQRPPFFEDFSLEAPGVGDIRGAYVLALLGDSVTTDHISPAGSIAPGGPAGQFLAGWDVAVKDFNSFGARRGNHEVMMRGTFANARLKNFLVEGTDGNWTMHWPSGKKMTIYDAAMAYRKEGKSLIIIAGKEYGSGSSRDWAAKGTMLLGVKAVIAEDYERIHRSNLLGMGVLPLEFLPGQNRVNLGICGQELFDIEGALEDLKPRQKLGVRAKRPDGTILSF
ncbi:MAG: aconitate hydratase AcnA, partial [Elusimicrobiota bacterium]